MKHLLPVLLGLGFLPAGLSAQSATPRIADQTRPTLGDRAIPSTRINLADPDIQRKREVTLPIAPALPPQPDYRMIVGRPDDSIDYKLIIAAPDHRYDYKILTPRDDVAARPLGRGKR